MANILCSRVSCTVQYRREITFEALGNARDFVAVFALTLRGNFEYLAHCVVVIGAISDIAFGISN